MTMLTVYLVLLFGVPSNLQLTALGSLGKPATMWGLVLLVWWLLSHLQIHGRQERPARRAVHTFFVLFCIVVLVSFAAALLRGQPADQLGSVTTSLFRVASWCGVLLVASDGIRTRDELLILFRRLTITAVILALLGFVQMLTRSTLLEWTASLPGWTAGWGGMDIRGGMLRATGTSTHPLEYSSSMTGLLPLTIAYAAISLGRVPTRALRWFVPPAAVLALLLLTMTRSAIIGLAIVVLVLLPFLPRSFRMTFLVLLALGGTVIAVAFPSVFMTTFGAFSGIADDPSALSRTNALARVPEFASASPVFGSGLGTFFPRYYIFDNAWVLMLLEAGLVGVGMFALMMLAGIWGPLKSAVAFRDPEGRALAGALGASLSAMTVQMALFDGLGFGIFAGTLFLMLGLGVAVRGISEQDASASLDRGPRGVRADASLRSPSDAPIGVSAPARRARPSEEARQSTRRGSAQYRRTEGAV